MPWPSYRTTYWPSGSVPPESSAVITMRYLTVLSLLAGRLLTQPCASRSSLDSSSVSKADWPLAKLLQVVLVQDWHCVSQAPERFIRSTVKTPVE